MTLLVTLHNLCENFPFDGDTGVVRIWSKGSGGGMRKSDIANDIYDIVGISKNEAADIVEMILNLLKDVLKKGESVKIAGFGNFIVRSKGARKGRNPRTGEEIGITPRRVVTFRPSQVFKKFVNS